MRTATCPHCGRENVAIDNDGKWTKHRHGDIHESWCRQGGFDLFPIEGYICLGKSAYPIPIDDIDAGYGIIYFRTEDEVQRWITDHPKANAIAVELRSVPSTVDTLTEVDDETPDNNQEEVTP